MTAQVTEAEMLRSDCEFLLSCIDMSNEAGAPPDELDPEDIATIEQIRVAIAIEAQRAVTTQIGTVRSTKARAESIAQTVPSPSSRERK